VQRDTRSAAASPLGVGVIGCGRVAESRHIPALQDLPGARVAALADVDPARLHQVADRYGIQRRYASAAELLADQGVDVVAVCVPAAFHAEVALAALDAGKHLFVEKPLALSLEECDRILERAARTPVKTTVGFNLRSHRLVRRAREIVGRGDLGPIEGLSSVSSGKARFDPAAPAWRSQQEMGGGVLFEQAIHHFDAWRLLLQTEVEEVVARSHGGDETAVVSATLASGALVSAIFSEASSEHNEFAIYGQAGRLAFSCFRFDSLELSSAATPPGTTASRLRALRTTLTELPNGLLVARRGGDFDRSYQAEWAAFLHAIRTGGPPPCTLEDGRRAVQIALAALASAASGQPVRVATAPRSISTLAGHPSPSPSGSDSRRLPPLPEGEGLP
jgi:myo-inositol 2-dehydrogenase / D-chiro-inositol 1-dehydrogenase